jgi:hypothetical protein
MKCFTFLLFYKALDLINQKILWLPSIYEFERTGTNLNHPTVLGKFYTSLIDFAKKTMLPAMKQTKCIDLDSFSSAFLTFFNKKMPICNIKICLLLRIFLLRFSNIFPYLFIIACLCIWVCLLNRVNLINRVCSLNRVCLITRFEKRSYPACLLGSARLRNYLKIPPCSLIRVCSIIKQVRVYVISLVASPLVI